MSTSSRAGSQRSTRSTRSSQQQNQHLNLEQEQNGAATPEHNSIPEFLPPSSTRSAASSRLGRASRASDGPLSLSSGEGRGNQQNGLVTPLRFPDFNMQSPLNYGTPGSISSRSRSGVGTGVSGSERTPSHHRSDINPEARHVRHINVASPRAVR